MRKVATFWFIFWQHRASGWIHVVSEFSNFLNCKQFQQINISNPGWMEAEWHKYENSSYFNLTHLFKIFPWQEMRAWKTTMSRTARWALWSMRFMQWLMAFMICTKSCAQTTLACVRRWIPLTAVSCWTIYSRPPLPAYLGRKSTLM